MWVTGHRPEKRVGPPSANDLRHAIDNMPDGPAVPGRCFAQWPTIGRHRIKSWSFESDAEADCPLVTSFATARPAHRPHD